METTSRWQTGSGAPGLVLDLLDSAGWTAAPDESGNTAHTSLDGTLRVVFGPETPAYHHGGPLWTITHTPGAQPDPAPCDDCGLGHQARPWTATFGDAVPVEAIAAFLTDLTDSEPLDPRRADHYQAEPSGPSAD